MTSVNESKVQSKLSKEGFRKQSFAILSDQPFYYPDRVRCDICVRVCLDATYYLLNNSW